MWDILMATCIIDVIEGRDEDITDIPGAFLQTDMIHCNRTVCVRLCDFLADILVNIDPSNFAEKVFLEGGQKMIYAAIKKDLYGALIKSLLFWWDLYGAMGS